MKPITRYQSEDGSIFDTPEGARDRDSLIAVVKEAMIPLGPDERDKSGCDHANGHGYVQHTPEAIAAARANLMPITRRCLAWWFKKHLELHGHEPVGVHPSWYIRMLDGGDKPLCDAWYRLQCIDKQGREWGQPYYAEHPEAARGQFEIQRKD